MLKLTTFDGLTVYVAPSAITSIEPADDGCSVFTPGKSYYVRDTAEQIMAMEAMQKFLHPPMMVMSSPFAGVGDGPASYMTRR